MAIPLGVCKVWDDGGDADGMRPSSVSISVFADGELRETVELSDANGWEKFWHVPMSNDAARIVWTIEETSVPPH